MGNAKYVGSGEENWCYTETRMIFADTRGRHEKDGI
jgi:hypothetical protein